MNTNTFKNGKSTVIKMGTQEARDIVCSPSTHHRAVNLIGQTFGRLTVVHAAKRRAGRAEQRWKCKCECGSGYVLVRSNSLTSGHTVSCGCSSREVAAVKAVKQFTTHGLFSHPLYQTWTSMRARCYRETATGYKSYGAKGVKVCERWRDSKTGFKRFLEDMGEKPTAEHTLDRINPFGHYTPLNCRWATPEQQAKNTRRAWINGGQLGWT